MVSFFTASVFGQTSEKTNPQPIILDKNSYTWTDIVNIKIVAPEWNKNPTEREIIGDKEREFVKVATREFKLKPYRLIESSENSGVFIGTVQLTGFSHDANGDKVSDTNPETSGTGPFDGKIQAKKGDGITVTFESDKKVYSSASSQIRWNIGELELDSESHFIDDKMTIRVKDPDMNINPTSIDSVSVSVSSDSDPSGFRVSLDETKPNSGIFEGTTFFITKKNNLERTLFVLPPDVIHVKYKDRTLPSPYSKDDILSIETKSFFKDTSLSTSRIEIQNSLLKNRIDFPVVEPKVGRQLLAAADLNSKQNYEQSMIYIVQVTNEDGQTVSLSWLNGVLKPYQVLNTGIIWQPQKEGLYRVDTFVWKSLSFPIALAESITNYYEVFP